MQSQVMSGPTREQVEDILRSGSINSKHASSNGMADAIQALYAPLVEDRDVALAALERAGYRRCDIPACNCGRWHAGPDSFKGKFDYALEQSAMYQDECERLRADLALAWPIAQTAAKWIGIRRDADVAYEELGDLLTVLTPDQRARLLEERP